MVFSCDSQKYFCMVILFASSTNQILYLNMTIRKHPNLTLAIHTTYGTFNNSQNNQPRISLESSHIYLLGHMMIIKDQLTQNMGQWEKIQ